MLGGFSNSNPQACWKRTGVQREAPHLAVLVLLIVISVHRRGPSRSAVHIVPGYHSVPIVFGAFPAGMLRSAPSGLETPPHFECGGSPPCPSLVLARSGCSWRDRRDSIDAGTVTAGPEVSVLVGTVPVLVLFSTSFFSLDLLPLPCTISTTRAATPSCASTFAGGGMLAITDTEEGRC